MTGAVSSVALTGATGFIGRALCSRLIESGFSVHALVRNPDAAHDLAAKGAVLHEGDLSSSAAIAQLLQHCNALIHTAGAVRGNCQQAFDDTNVQGTQTLVQAVARADRPIRVIHLSSLAAQEPELSWYSMSKWRGEKVLTESALDDWIVLRPPAVYGPGDKEMLPVFKAMSHGLATVPGRSSARTSLIHVDDLVEAILYCLRAQALPKAVFTVCDPTIPGYDWHDIADVAERVFQRRVRLLEVPRLVLDLFAHCNLALSHLLNYSPMLTPPKLRELRHPDWVVSSALFTQATAWQPQIDLEEGLTRLSNSAL